MEYFLLKSSGEQTGTYSIDQVRTMLKTGFVDADTRYWHEGISNWQPIDRIEESLAYPEPAPSAPPTRPPPAPKLGSLARAIPGPNQKVAASSRAAATDVPKFEKPVVPAVAAVSTRTPVELSPRELEPAAEIVPDVEPIIPVPVAQVRPRKSRLPLVLLSIFLLTLAGALIFVGFERHRAGNTVANTITLSGSNVYVLLDQAMIKAYEDDMRNSPVVESLKRQIDQSLDPVSQEKLDIGLEKENARHADEVTEKYIKMNKAEYIGSGTYPVVAYFDDNGVLITSRNGEAWVAITYQDNIVYVHRDVDSGP